MREIVTATVPPMSAVLVASEGNAHLLDALGRPASHFPQDGAGKFIPGLGPNDSWPLMVQIDELRAKGAQYLVVPRTSVGWLDGLPTLREHLDRRFRVITDDLERHGCLLYELDSPFFGGHHLGLPA